MKFNVTHARAFQGSNISVGVSADSGETIRSVSVKLDGFEVSAEDLADGTTDYEKDLSAVGDAGPGMDHELIVTATDQKLTPQHATREWTDS